MTPKSPKHLGMAHAIQKERRRIPGKAPARSTPAARKREVAKAQAFIDEAMSAPVEEPGPEPEAPKSTRKPREYTFTAEELREAREGGTGRSWRDVAKMLGLGNPGAARKAWADLMGQPHTEAKALAGRAKRGSGSTSRLVAAPKWDDTADRQTIVDSLNGAKILVSSTMGSGRTEEMFVAKVREFDDSIPERPAVVFTEGIYRYDSKTKEMYLDQKQSTGATRTIYLDRIIEVR